MSHRLVQEQLDQLTALLLTVQEDGDLDEEELLLLICGVEDAAAGLLPPFQFALISWMKRPAFDVFNCSFVLDCLLLQFSLFLCCSRRRFKRSPANFLERPAKRSGCRVTNSWATLSRAGSVGKTPTPFALAWCKKSRSLSRSNHSCFPLVAMLRSRLGTRTKTSQTRAVAVYLPLYQAVSFTEMIDGILLRFRFDRPFERPFRNQFSELAPRPQHSIQKFRRTECKTSLISELVGFFFTEFDGEGPRSKF